MRVIILIGICLQFAFGLPTTKNNYPELRSGHFQGDIVLGKERSAWNFEFLRWPNKEVPVVIEGNFSDEEVNAIFEAMFAFNQNTCVKFRPKRKDDKDYVVIKNDEEGCFSKVGRQKGEQPLNLGAGCLDKIGTAIHEFMHAIGFIHEHSRPDRDDYIDVIEANIEDGEIGNFNKYSSDLITTLDQPYDYWSLMHYPMNAFSKNGGFTIIPKEFDSLLGQRAGFSPIDIAKINKLYECK